MKKLSKCSVMNRFNAFDKTKDVPSGTLEPAASEEHSKTSNLFLYTRRVLPHFVPKIECLSTLKPP